MSNWNDTAAPAAAQIPSADGAGNADAGSSYAAVGIPQGLIVDQESGEIAGAVRRGGELVSLEPVEYGMWTTLLTPLTLGAAIKVASIRGWSSPEPVIARLADLNLLAPIDPGQAMDGTLSRLRPIPLGCGLGNLGGDPMRFEIQNAILSRPSPISLDVVTIMFWWELDGISTLGEVVSQVRSRVPGLSLPRANAIAAQLAFSLMVNRMLYLDSPRTTTN
jgi:hypothetical protein